MPELHIAAEPRTEFGKGAARRVRRADKVPGVVYGHGTDPQHVTLPGHDLMKALKTANVLLDLEVGGDHQLVLPKSVQRDPIKGTLEHVDLVIVRRGEKVTVDVGLHVSGEVGPGGMLDQQLVSLSVEAEATTIPTGFEIDVEGMPIGTSVHAKDVVLPAGTTLVTDPDALVLHVLAAPTAEQIDAELSEAEAEAGIEHDVPDATPEAGDDAQASASTEEESPRGARWPSPGWSSGWATPDPATPATGTTSGSGSSTRSPSGPVRRTGRIAAGPTWRRSRSATSEPCWSSRART